MNNEKPLRLLLAQSQRYSAICHLLNDWKNNPTEQVIVQSGLVEDLARSDALDPSQWKLLGEGYGPTCLSLLEKILPHTISQLACPVEGLLEVPLSHASLYASLVPPKGQKHIGAFLFVRALEEYQSFAPLFEVAQANNFRCPTFSVVNMDTDAQPWATAFFKDNVLITNRAMKFGEKRELIKQWSDAGLLSGGMRALVNAVCVNLGLAPLFAKTPKVVLKNATHPKLQTFASLMPSVHLKQQLKSATSKAYKKSGYRSPKM